MSRADDLRMRIAETEDEIAECESAGSFQEADDLRCRLYDLQMELESQFFKMYANGECEYIDFLSNALIAMHEREKQRIEQILKLESCRPSSYTIADAIEPVEIPEPRTPPPPIEQIGGV